MKQNTAVALVATIVVTLHGQGFPRYADADTFSFNPLDTMNPSRWFDGGDNYYDNGNYYPGYGSYGGYGAPPPSYAVPGGYGAPGYTAPGYYPYPSGPAPAYAPSASGGTSDAERIRQLEERIRQLEAERQLPPGSQMSGQTIPGYYQEPPPATGMRQPEPPPYNAPVRVPGVQSPATPPALPYDSGTPVFRPWDQ